MLQGFLAKERLLWIRVQSVPPDFEPLDYTRTFSTCNRRTSESWLPAGLGWNNLAYGPLLNEMLFDFHDRRKSISRGCASSTISRSATARATSSR